MAANQDERAVFQSDCPHSVAVAGPRGGRGGDDANAATEQAVMNPAEFEVYSPHSEAGSQPVKTGPNSAHAEALLGSVSRQDSQKEANDAERKHAEAQTPLMTRKNLLVALPNILIPTLYGYEIGLVGVYATLYSFATNCSLYGAETPCETLSAARCSWKLVEPLDNASAASYMCVWRDRVTCSQAYFTESACAADSICQWNYSSRSCGNQVGYKSILSGLFAGSMIIGAMAGSLAAGTVTRMLNYRLSFLIIGIISTIASILTHVTTGIFEYWLLFAARIILGVAMGWQAVVAPAYVSEFAPKQHQKTLGTFFQVFVAFGCFVGAAVGTAVGQSIQYDKNVNANVMGRMQGFIAPPTLLSILVMGLYFMCKDVPKHRESGATEDVDKEEHAGTAEPKRYPAAQMIGPVLLGFTMACTLQLTGINAIMNYAPTIMSNLGLEPLVGNVIVMAWNSLTAFGVIPLTKYFTLRKLFLGCTLIGSLACLFLCGIPVFPGVTKNVKVKEGIAITGIAVFIGAYEMGVGPAFFVLAGDVFPASFRPIGASLTVMIQFILNVIINICYPIATEGMSGGPSGDQDRGQSIAFIFFGCIGLVTFTVEYFFLHPWDESEPQAEQAEKAEVQAPAPAAQ